MATNACAELSEPAASIEAVQEALCKLSAGRREFEEFLADLFDRWLDRQEQCALLEREGMMLQRQLEAARRHNAKLVDTLASQHAATPPTTAMAQRTERLRRLLEDLIGPAGAETKLAPRSRNGYHDHADVVRQPCHCWLAQRVVEYRRPEHRWQSVGMILIEPSDSAFLPRGVPAAAAAPAGGGQPWPGRRRPPGPGGLGPVARVPVGAACRPNGASIFIRLHSGNFCISRTTLTAGEAAATARSGSQRTAWWSPRRACGNLPATRWRFWKKRPPRATSIRRPSPRKPAALATRRRHGGRGPAPAGAGGDQLGAQRLAALVQRPWMASAWPWRGGPPVYQLLAAVLNCLPVECRMRFSFSTELKFSSRRPLPDHRPAVRPGGAGLAGDTTPA